MGSNQTNESTPKPKEELEEKKGPFFKIEKELRKDEITVTSIVSLIYYPKLYLKKGSPLIVKKFTFDDSKEPYKQLKEQGLRTLNEILANGVGGLNSNQNVLPFRYFEDPKTKSVTIVRQYIKYTLYDAIDYLRCVSDIEKNWICYQLVQGLYQIHQTKQCHGDLKPSNILINSKLSVFISDIAVFKPVYIDINYYKKYDSFFFSSTSDKSCFLAPERFVSKGAEISNESDPKMDIFSLGVIIAGIYLDKFDIFTQEELMQYSDEMMRKKIKNIKDENIKSLIREI